MKKDYSKWCSVALITAIYLLAGVAGVLLFRYSISSLQFSPLMSLFLADVLATLIVWASGRILPFAESVV